jgi:hypothetical protein
MAVLAQIRRCDGVMDRIAWFSQFATGMHSVVEDCSEKWLAGSRAVKIKSRCVGWTAFIGGSGVVVLWRSWVGVLGRRFKILGFG